MQFGLDDDIATFTEQDWLDALDMFGHDREEASRRLRHMVINGGEPGTRLCVNLLVRLEANQATTFLAGVLADARLLAPLMSDQIFCSRNAAIHLCRMAVAADPTFNAQWLQYAMAMQPARDAVLLRVVSVLRMIPGTARLLTTLMQLMRHANPIIRAEAALLISHEKRDPDWVRRCLADPDARVRAHAIEGLWGAANAEAIKVFREASLDAHHRVAANGLVGMHRAGLESAADRLEEMACHEDPLFRAAAAWAMGECGCQRFETLLKELAQSSTPFVHRCALRSLVSIRKKLNI